MDIIVKYHNGMEEFPLKIKEGNAGIDVYSAENVFISQGATKKVSLGISIKLPKGYCALLMPRSSTYKNWGVLQTNCVGLIDESYQGPNDIWMVEYFANRGDVEIHRGDKIGQFIIVPDLTSQFNIVEGDLDGVDRGGFGTSGKR